MRLKPGESAPPFTLNDIYGRHVSLPAEGRRPTTPKDWR